eukprot:5224465-Ditylum_brightwellii.AAC.1
MEGTAHSVELTTNIVNLQGEEGSNTTATTEESVPSVELIASIVNLQGRGSNAVATTGNSILREGNHIMQGPSLKSKLITEMFNIQGGGTNTEEHADKVSM